MKERISKLEDKNLKIIQVEGREKNKNIYSYFNLVMNAQHKKGFF